MMYSIMIVDDEKAIRDNLPKALPFSEYGFFVCTTASNGKEALEKLAEYKPDLIFLDVCMPIIDGLEFLDNLRKGSFKDTLVVMLSGYSDFEYARKAMRFGVKAYLTKPVDEDEAIPILEDAAREIKRKQQTKEKEIIHEHSTLFMNLYKYELGQRKELENYFILHLVLMWADHSEDTYPDKILQGFISRTLNEDMHELLFVRGSISTYMINKNVLNAFQNETAIFLKHIIYQLKQLGLGCVLLLDDRIFFEEGNSFREDYSRHLHGMQTKVFYNAVSYIYYQKEEGYNCLTKLFVEEQAIDRLRASILNQEYDNVKQAFSLIVNGIREQVLSIEYVHEVSFRIYYMLVEVMRTVTDTEVDDTLLKRPEWRDYPLFITFQKWMDNLWMQIKDTYAYVERSRKLMSLGICKEVVEYLHKHYKEPINLKEVSDIFHLNAAYLGRMFQKSTGISFKQYINNLRLSEAKRLLLQTNLLIYEIANEVGYNECKYFIEKFTNEVGTSPLSFRKKNDIFLKK